MKNKNFKPGSKAFIILPNICSTPIKVNVIKKITQLSSNNIKYTVSFRINNRVNMLTVDSSSLYSTTEEASKNYNDIFFNQLSKSIGNIEALHESINEAKRQLEIEEKKIRIIVKNTRKDRRLSSTDLELIHFLVEKPYLFLLEPIAKILDKYID